MWCGITLCLPVYSHVHNCHAVLNWLLSTNLWAERVYMVCDEGLTIQPQIKRKLHSYFFYLLKWVAVIGNDFKFESQWTVTWVFLIKLRLKNLSLSWILRCGVANMNLNHLPSFLRVSIQGKSVRLEQHCAVTSLLNPDEDKRAHSSFILCDSSVLFCFSLTQIYSRACSFSMWSTWPHPFGRAYYYGQGWFGLL